MTPLLRDGDLVLVNQLAYREHGPQSGDIVAARPGWLGGRACVKRVVATPREAAIRLTETQQPAADQYLLLGDNLRESRDSRTLGPVTRAELLGHVWFRLWPPTRLK